MKIICSLVILVLGFVNAEWSFAQDGRLAEPTEDALKRAEVTVNQLFHSDYAKRGPEELRALANKLLNLALQSNDDPAARFVLYRESSELAAKSGDFLGALAILEELGQCFETDLATLKIRVVKAAGDAGLMSRQQLAEIALALVPDILASANPKAAEDLIEMAVGVGNKLKIAELVARAEGRRTELKSVLTEFQRYLDALKKLQTNPDDAKAIMSVGTYACFYKGDWKLGLPYLSKCGDKKLSVLADADLANPDTTRAQVEVADGWWDLFETLPATSRRQVIARAAYWYGVASPNLHGISEVKARERLLAYARQSSGLNQGLEAIFGAFAGLWEIRYTNTAIRRYMFDSRGNLFTLAGGKFLRGRLVPEADHMLLCFEKAKLESIVIRDGELLVKHFNPPNRLVATGVGIRKELPEKKSQTMATGSFRDIAGIWLAPQSDKSYRIYQFGSKGTGVFMTEDDIIEGHLTRKDDHIIFDCADNKICRIKLFSGGLRINTFDPSSTYPDGRPVVVSAAIRLSR
jgi:hypothetical protein